MSIKTFSSTTLSSSDVNTYLANPGLVCIGGATFSGIGTSGLAVVCFSNTYDNYKIVLSDVVGVSGTNALYCLLRSSATGNSATGYYMASNYASFASTPISTNFGQSNGSYGMYLCDFSTTSTTSAIAELQGPNKAQWTRLSYSGAFIDNNTQGNGLHKVATAYDSIFLYTNGATVSGRYDIYGYRKG